MEPLLRREIPLPQFLKNSQVAGGPHQHLAFIFMNPNSDLFFSFPLSSGGSRSLLLSQHSSQWRCINCYLRVIGTFFFSHFLINNLFWGLWPKKIIKTLAAYFWGWEGILNESDSGEAGCLATFYIRCLKRKFSSVRRGKPAQNDRESQLG